MTRAQRRGPIADADMAQRLTVTCITSGTLEPGMEIEGLPPPLPPRWSWLHLIRSIRAARRWRRRPQYSGKYVIVGQCGPASFEIMPQHRDGCCCIDCRNKVM